MPQWIVDYATQLGSVLMAFFGGVLAYIKAYELAEVEWSRKTHIYNAISRQLYAIFASMLTWYAIAWARNYMTIHDPAVPVLIALAAYNGSRVVDFATTTAFDWIRKRLGLEPKDEPK